MVEFGREVAPEIVFDEEDAQEIGIAACAENVPGKCRQGERRGCERMKKAEGVAPAVCEERPEKDAASAQNYGHGTFGEDGGAEEESEKKEGQPRSSSEHLRSRIGRRHERENAGVARRCEAQSDSGADHRDRQHGAERHVRGGGAGEADHANRGGQKKEKPARGLGAVDAPGKPCESERREESRDGRGQASRGFGCAEELEAQRRTPIIEWGLFEPGLAVEPRRDPIAGLYHLARDPGVARLVGADKADSAEMAKIADIEGGQYQQRPAETSRQLRPVPALSLHFVFGHGRMSLASNLYLQAIKL